MKKKSILISAIAMLAVSAIVLSTASYAWFVGSVTPSITNIEVGVIQRNLISLSGNDGATWSPVLDVTDTDAVLAANYMNKWWDATSSSYQDNTSVNHANKDKALDAVTPLRSDMNLEGTGDDYSAKGKIIAPFTDDEVNGMNFLSKSVTDFADDTQNVYAADTTNFLRLEFLMQADAECDVDLKTDPTAAVRTWFDATQATYATNDASQAKIAYALRLAIVWGAEYNLADDTDPENIVYSGRDDTVEGMIIWAPFVRADGSTNATDVGNSGLRGYNASTGWAEGDDYEKYDGENIMFYGDHKYGESGSEVHGVPLFNFTEQYGIRSCAMYIWIEGQDWDCNTQMAGGMFAALVAFSQGNHTLITP